MSKGVIQHEARKLNGSLDNNHKYLLQTKIQYNNGNTFLENGTNLFKEATPWKLEIED